MIQCCLILYLIIPGIRCSIAAMEHEPPKEFIEEFFGLLNSSFNQLLDSTQNIQPFDDVGQLSNMARKLRTPKESSETAGGQNADNTQSGIEFNELQTDPLSLGVDSGSRLMDGSLMRQQNFMNDPSETTTQFRSIRLNRHENEREIRQDFAGYRDINFRPTIECDRFEKSRRHCILIRQLGTTLTLGVEEAGHSQPGTTIHWYRYLKKHQSDHYIRENLKSDYLPWNLNLGGSKHELRISPVTETDRGYNYFVAELQTLSRANYRQGHVEKPTVRFTIEPVHLDMGPLYHGEEIVLYARSYMELPQASVQFLWSLFDSSDMIDHGLPSNMHLNTDRSSVIIKELKTYQNQILSCTVYTNKNVFLARRDFLFRGSVNDETPKNQQPSTSRKKRSIYIENHQFEDHSDDIDYRNERPFYFVPDDQRVIHRWKKPWVDLETSIPLSDQQSNRRDYRSEEFDPHSNSEQSPVEDNTKFQEHIQLEPLGFDDIESQIMATCVANHDCNVHAVCTRASYSGQKFCKCLHGYNGNGLFCMTDATL